MKSQTKVRPGGPDKTVRPTGRSADGTGRTLDRAIDDIHYIRDLINASQDFFVSGWSGVSAGIITVAGAAITAWVAAHPREWDVPLTLWLLWITIGILLALGDIVFFVRTSRRAGRPVFSPLLAKIAFCESIMTLEGFALTFVFIVLRVPEYIPGAWLLSFGSTLTAVGVFIPGGLWVLGLTVFLASIAAFVVPSGGLWCVGLAGAAMCLWGAAYLIKRGR